jgi:hypothetical protein
VVLVLKVLASTGASSVYRASEVITTIATATSTRASDASALTNLALGAAG